MSRIRRPRAGEPNPYPRWAPEWFAWGGSRYGMAALVLVLEAAVLLALAVVLERFGWLAFAFVVLALDNIRTHLRAARVRGQLQAARDELERSRTCTVPATQMLTENPMTLGMERWYGNASQ